MHPRRASCLRRALHAFVAVVLLASGSAGAALAANPYLDSVGNIDIDRLLAFGDSYTLLGRKARFMNWVELLRAEGDINRPRNCLVNGGLSGCAVGGATAATLQTNNLRAQVGRFLDARNSGRVTLGPRDLTVVYVGYNDIDDFPDLSRSKIDYTRQINRLINTGRVTQNGRHLFLVNVHDWGMNPNQASDRAFFRNRTIAWNRHVTDVALGRARVAVVDLFTTFDRVFADPGGFGLTNVTTPDPANSNSTALFDDVNHFGGRGQQIIKQVFEDYITRAGDWASSLTLGSAAIDRLGDDLERGLTFGLEELAGTRQLGLVAVPIGEMARSEGEGLREEDVARASFAQAHHPGGSRDGGVAFNYALSDGINFGVALSRYDDSADVRHESSSSTAAVASDAVTMYLTQELGGFDLRTRLGVSDDRHGRREHDDLLDATDRASYGGSTTELVQRVSYPVALGSGTLTPWLEVSRRAQKVDEFTIESPYISDVTYSAAEASETLAGIGLNARAEPIWLGDETNLRLFGAISYTQSLVREDYHLTISEAASEAKQRETIERGQLQRLGLNVGARLNVGDRLSIGADVGLTQDAELGARQQAMLRFNYRF